MNIIAKGRGQGKTTELIKISAEKQIPIVCGAGSKEYIRNMANDMDLKIPEPLTYKELNLKQYESKEILIDNAEYILSSMLSKHKIDTITVSTNDKQGNTQSNYVDNIVKELKNEAQELNKNLLKYRQNKDMNLYISTLKSLRETMNLIRDYDWREEHSEYHTGDDNHIEVSTWQQNSDGTIRNHKRYIVDKKFDDVNMNRIEKEINNIGITTRINDVFRPFEDVMRDMSKMWNCF